MNFIKIDWSKEVVLRLINLWKEKEVLYNVKDPLYHNKHARNDDFENISSQMNDMVPNMTPVEVKTKINYIRSQYGRELQKISESNKSGSSTDEVYIPTAYWFDHMHFLKDFVTVRKGISTLSKTTLHTVVQDEDSLSQEMNSISDYEIPTPSNSKE